MREALKLAREAADQQTRVAKRGIWVSIGIGILAVAITVLLSLQPWASAARPRAKITGISALGTIVPTPVSVLAAPPRYPTGERADHCASWSRWLAANKAAQVGNPTISLTAPTQTAVTIKSVTSKLIRIFQPGALTQIACTPYGPPRDIVPPNGFLIGPLNHPERAGILIDKFSNEAPPHTLVRIPAGSTVEVELYVGAIKPHAIEAAHEPATCIEWQVRFHVLVGQRAETLTAGSRRKPLRNCGVSEDLASYDYDFRRHAWREVHLLERPGRRLTPTEVSQMFSPDASTGVPDPQTR
jgi:hypothetical protein